MRVACGRGTSRRKRENGEETNRMVSWEGRKEASKEEFGVTTAMDEQARARGNIGGGGGGGRKEKERTLIAYLPGVML